MDFIQTLAAEFSVSAEHVGNIIKLIDEGNTIPFIARYRKEQTGSMDDQVLRELDERLGYLRGLEKRKEEVTSSIESQEAMTPEISAALAAATTLAAVEDIYRPYKPKRKTRASIAKEKGLSPLAELLLAQEGKTPAREAAAAYINEEKGVASAEDALAGALDIIAEQISDDAKLRALLRAFYLRTAQISSKAAKEEESVYEQYYDFSEPAAKIPQHRILALDRGEREGFLKVSISVDSEEAVRLLCFNVVKRNNEYGELVGNAVGDAYSRLIRPSLERELRSALTEKAAEGAIKVFSENLRHLLLQPPIKGKVALGLDPGYRMGCKVAVVDATGKVLTTDVIYPVPPFNRIDQAKTTVKKLIKTYGVEIIAIGNGTASKETELFAVDVLREIGGSVQYMVVSESGASVYSASKLAAAEFPEYDVNVRSAISIARRLQDPLAELVKIDPKAVGVGQYQHDMPAAKLDEALSGVVEYCVNTVGVDLNTASASLLSHVAGVNATIAKNIVAKREADGEFKSRTELKKVAKLGPKAFEQCAGFLRVPGAKNKLDTTAVHPESYNAAKQVLELCGYTTADIGTDALLDLEEKAKSIGLTSLAAQVGVGVPTLNDILAELLRPGRDMRDELPQPLLRSDIMEMKDLKPGMELTGTVRNVIDFGAFVDIGVHQDGLVHISQITNRYIKHPSEVLKVGDIVKVWVLSVDVAKHRIGLTMKQPKEAAAN